MKELIKFTFDFFAHVLPGLLIIFSLSLLFYDIEFYDSLIKNTGEIKKTGMEDVSVALTTMVVIFAYVIGFAVNPIGRFLYRSIGFRIWKNHIVNNVDLFISDKFVLIRHFSPINFQYVETWNTYCAMSHNLSVASLVLMLVSGVKIFEATANLWIWVPLALLSLCLFFIFLHRAVTFYHWASHDLNAAIKTLALSDKKI